MNLISIRKYPIGLPSCVAMTSTSTALNIERQVTFSRRLQLQLAIVISASTRLLLPATNWPNWLNWPNWTNWTDRSGAGLKCDFIATLQRCQLHFNFIFNQFNAIQIHFFKWLNLSHRVEFFERCNVVNCNLKIHFQMFQFEFHWIWRHQVGFFYEGGNAVNRTAAPIQLSTHLMSFNLIFKQSNLNFIDFDVIRLDYLFFKMKVATL